MTDQITISKGLYDALRDHSKWLQCLRDAGVHEWSGYDEATTRYMDWGKMKRYYEKHPPVSGVVVPTDDPAVVVPTDDPVQIMREAGWDDDMLRAAGMIP